MKKLLLCITVLVSFSGNAQLAMETFTSATFPPTGWTTGNTVASRPWALTTTLNPAGQTTFNINGPSAFINWIAAPNDAHLTTPSFSLTGYASATLEFKAKVGWSYMIDLDAGDLIVQVSTNGGTVWTDLWTEIEGGWVDDGDGDPDTDLYNTRTITVDLDTYAGQAAVLVRFRYLAADADAISLDDVRVFGTLANEEFSASKFATYPNPTNSIVTLSNAESILVSEVAITDVNGRIIKTIKVDNLSEVEMNVSELTSGIYFMNLTTDSGKAVKKFIKN